MAEYRVSGPMTGEGGGTKGNWVITRGDRGVRGASGHILQTAGSKEAAVQEARSMASPGDRIVVHKKGKKGEPSPVDYVETVGGGGGGGNGGGGGLVGGGMADYEDRMGF